MAPRINAVAVTTSNIKKTIEFYSLLGFEFPEIKEDDGHVETVPSDKGIRLMIDSKQMITDILGKSPVPGNHSSFAVEYDSAKEVDDASLQVKNAGFEIVKEPWDAFWGQRYAVIKDPEGYLVDLYAKLEK